MARTFVGFDDSYRVPVPVNVSRAVSCGGIVHLCGQLHMDGAGNSEDPCDLVAQEVPGAMIQAGCVAVSGGVQVAETNSHRGPQQQPRMAERPGAGT